MNEQHHQPDGRRRRGDARREQILSAAVALFAARGYEATHIADIARDAGVTDAGLLHHFPTKAALFLELVKRREESYEFEPSHEITSVRDLVDTITTGVHNAAQRPDYVRFRAMLGGLGLLDGSLVTDRLRNNLIGGVQRTADIIRTGIANGEIRAETDPEQAARELIALNDGLRTQAVTAPALDYPTAFHRAAQAWYQRLAAA